MNSQIHTLVDKINSACCCSSCGGRVSSNHCKFCSSLLSDTQSAEIEDATKELLACIEDYSFRNVGYRDYTIYELFRLSDLKIDSIDAIIEESGYEKKLNEVISCVINSSVDQNTGNISSLEEMSEDGFDPYDMLFYFCCEKDISRLKAFENMSKEERDKIQYRSLLLLFRKIYNKEYTSNNEKMLKEVYSKIAYMYARICGLKVSVGFTDLDEKTLGLCKKARVFLSNSIIDSAPEDILNIIFHEYIHASQNNTINNYKVLYEGSLLSIKDSLLESRLGREYYTDNYPLFFDEQEAHILSSSITCDFLKSIRVEPSKEFIEESKKVTDYYSRFVGQTKRVYAGVLIEQDVLFDNFVHLSKKDLDEHPQLRFEYKEDEDGRVVRKTLPDLESDYNSYLNGDLKWNGDHDMICSMYEKRIAKMKEEKPATY